MELTSRAVAAVDIEQMEKQADRIFVPLLWGHALFSLLLAFWYHTFLQTITVAVPTALLVQWMVRNHPGKTITRCVVGAALMVFSALYISQAHGMTEMHFHVFAAMAFLLVYRDWRPIVTAAATIAVHHLLFTLLQTLHVPVYIYTTALNAWMLTIIHALFVVFEASILVLLAQQMRAEWNHQQEVNLYHHEMTKVARSIAAGDLNCTVTPLCEEDYLGCAFAEMLATLHNLLTSLADQNETITLTSKTMQATSEQVNNAAEHIAATMQGVAGAAALSSQTSGQMAQASEQQAAGATRAAEAMDTLIRTIQEIGKVAEEQEAAASDMHFSITEAADTMKQVLEVAKQVTQSVQQSQQYAEKGGISVRETVAGMSRIQDQVATSAERVQQLDVRGQEIGAIVETINQIADQTNLLALNAAIEAARAGEHGLGFAVVANEVRKLAERSTRATGEIAALIESVRNMVAEAVQAMENSRREVAEGVLRSEEAGSALKQIQVAACEVAQEVDHLVRSAADAGIKVQKLTGSADILQNAAMENGRHMLEIQNGAGAVSDVITMVAGISQETAAGAEEMSAVAAEVSSGAEQVALVLAKQRTDIAGLNDIADDLTLRVEETIELMQRFQLKEVKEENYSPPTWEQLAA